MDKGHATAPQASALDSGSAITSDDVAGALAAIETTFSRSEGNGVAVVDGHGIRIVVERGGLEVCDGLGPQRRTRRFDKATHGLSRLVIGNVTGMVSFQALRWLDALDVG